MSSIELSVKESCFTSGGGDFLVKYEGTLDFEGTEQIVVIENTIPAEIDADQMGYLKAGIVRAAQAATDRGFVLFLRNVVIHPIDFKLKKYQQSIFREVQAALATIPNGDL